MHPDRFARMQNPPMRKDPFIDQHKMEIEKRELEQMERFARLERERIAQEKRERLEAHQRALAARQKRLEEQRERDRIAAEQQAEREEFADVALF